GRVGRASGRSPRGATPCRRDARRRAGSPPPPPSRRHRSGPTGRPRLACRGTRRSRSPGAGTLAPARPRARRPSGPHPRGSRGPRGSVAPSAPSSARSETVGRRTGRRHALRPLTGRTSASTPTVVGRFRQVPRPPTDPTPANARPPMGWMPAKAGPPDPARAVHPSASGAPGGRRTPYADRSRLHHPGRYAAQDGPARGVTTRSAGSPMTDPRAIGWTSRLPLVLVLLSLGALPLIPILVQRTVAGLRSRLTDIGHPARALRTEIHLLLALATAGTRAYLLSGDERYLAGSRGERARRVRSQEALLELTRRYGPQVHAAAVELLKRIGPVDALHDSLYSGLLRPS